MPARKDRTPVVLDTNVVIGYYLSRNPSSANSQVYRLWRDQRTLQLIVSDPVMKNTSKSCSASAWKIIVFGGSRIA